MSEEILYPRAGAARRLWISLRKLDQLISRKEIRVIRIGRRTLVPAAELERFATRAPVRSGAKAAKMASKPVVRVLRLVDNVAECSAGWTARCPAHADNVNSLSIGEGANGRVLIFCHAGCTFEEIIGALGLRVRDLFVRRKGAK
jgi:excisionase family DNA binding protein